MTFKAVILQDYAEETVEKSDEFQKDGVGNLLKRTYGLEGLESIIPVWNAVVRVEGAKGFGTGFLLFHPLNEIGRRFIITNRHVANDLKEEYTVRFFYDSDTADYSECKTISPAIFYSERTADDAPMANHLSNQLDFVVLELKLSGLH
jgi:S1-C subfamily serine protease